MIQKKQYQTIGFDIHTQHKFVYHGIEKEAFIYINLTKYFVILL